MTDQRVRWQVRSASATVACACGFLVAEYARGYVCSADGDAPQEYGLISAGLFMVVAIVSTVRWSGGRFYAVWTFDLSRHTLVTLEFFDAVWFAWIMEVVHIVANGLLIASLASAYEMRTVCGKYAEPLISHTLVFLYGAHVFLSCVSHQTLSNPSISKFHELLPMAYYFVAFALVVASIIMAMEGGESTGSADPLTTNTMYLGFVSLAVGPLLMFVSRMKFFKHVEKEASNDRRDFFTGIGGFLCAFGASSVLFIMLFGLTGDHEVLPYATTSHTLVLFFAAIGVLTSMPFADLEGFSKTIQYEA